METPQWCRAAPPGGWRGSVVTPGGEADIPVGGGWSPWGDGGDLPGVGRPFPGMGRVPGFRRQSRSPRWELPDRSPPSLGQ